MSGEAQQVIEQFWAIQDDGDYTKLAPLFAEDAVVEDPVWGTHVGREAILGFMTTMVKEMGERKIHFTVDEIFGDDHACWARWTTRGCMAWSRRGAAGRPPRTWSTRCRASKPRTRARNTCCSGSS